MTDYNSKGFYEGGVVNELEEEYDSQEADETTFTRSIVREGNQLA